MIGNEMAIAKCRTWLQQRWQGDAVWRCLLARADWFNLTPPPHCLTDVTIISFSVFLRFVFHKLIGVMILWRFTDYLDKTRRLLKTRAHEFTI